MRIIAGEFRGRKLKAPGGEAIRPTADRLKETLFDILGERVRGAVVLDVFAGTGAIGLEALSRGAREVIFVERAAEAARLIRQNLELCRIERGYRLMQRDAFAALRQLAREGCSADIFFLDPPYDWKAYGDLLALLFEPMIARAGAVVVIEHERRTGLPEKGDRFVRTRTVAQGDHCLTFFSAGAPGDGTA